jgi:hypothetical protein
VADDNLNSVRILVLQEGRRFCRFLFTKKDASLYIIPYARNNRYLFGGHRVARREVEASFDASGQLESDDGQLPHLSLHESGQVHAHGDEDKARP